MSASKTYTVILSELESILFALSLSYLLTDLECGVTDDYLTIEDMTPEELQRTGNALLTRLCKEVDIDLTKISIPEPDRGNFGGYDA